MLQVCVGILDVFKRSDAIGTSICRGSADDIFINPILDVFSDITCGSWNFQGENHILLYLNVFNNCLYAGKSLQVAHDVTAMIYPPNILSFVDNNNHQIVTKFASVLFNPQSKALKHDGHLYKFRNFMLASLLQYNKYFKVLAG